MNIVITGASSGVGFEAALDFILSDNHQVVALARSEKKAGSVTFNSQKPEPGLHTVSCQI